MKKEIYNQAGTKLVAVWDTEKVPFVKIDRAYGKRENIVRKDVYSIDEVLTKVVVSNRKKKVDFDGDMIKMSSLRLLVFREKGCQCSRCGIQGLYFAKEKSSPKEECYHFNLYGLDEKGNEVLMTKDYIIAKSLGGSDSLENLEPMCFHCNCIIKQEQERKERMESITT